MNKTYPFTEQYRDLLDVEVLTNVGPVYSLGRMSELEAGLRGFEITPWFGSMEELEAHLQVHRDQYDRMVEAETVWMVGEGGKVIR